MSLKLNLGDIHLTFQVKGYHKPQNKSWDEEWCKISLSLRSRDWLNYKIVEDEILLCCEIDALTKQLETVRNYKQLEKRTLSFIEPDFNFTFYPSANNRTPIVDWIINFWTDRKALSANCLSLQLDMMDISNLLNYLHHVQSQTNEKYEPVTGDGLTERQLFEVLEKSIADAETGKCFTHEEVMESLRKQIEEYKENNPIAKLTLDFSKVDKTMTISQSTFKVLSYPEKFDVLFNKERKQLCVIDDKSLSSETKDVRTPFTAPHGDFSCESNMFLLKLLQYVPNLENGKIYSLLGFYRADINGVIFSLSDYQLTEECSQ